MPISSGPMAASEQANPFQRIHLRTRSFLSLTNEVTYFLTKVASPMLKKEGDDPSRSSLPIIPWKIRGNFFIGSSFEFSRLRINAGFPHGTSSPP